jgi:hypothetical protein
MRQMADAVNVAALPGGYDLYAGYLDGNYRTVGSVRSRFPGAKVVEIAVQTGTNAGDVFDTEPGNPGPDSAARWVQMRRNSGAWWAGIYTMKAWWGQCLAALRNIGIDPGSVPFWIADWTCHDHLLDGTVATQWSGPSGCGGSIDVSAVADFWPGVDDAAPTKSAPARKLNPGELGMTMLDRDTGTVWLVGPGSCTPVRNMDDWNRLKFVGVPHAGDAHGLEIVAWAQTFGASQIQGEPI